MAVPVPSSNLCNIEMRHVSIKSKQTNIGNDDNDDDGDDNDHVIQKLSKEWSNYGDEAV